MSTLTVTITSPGPNTTVGSRSITVRGGLTLHPSGGHTLVGHASVSVSFGINGPTVAATVTADSSWVCTGSPAAGIHPSTPITITASASASFKFFIPADRSWDIEDVGGSASVSVVLPPPVGPALTIAPPDSPLTIVTDELPKTVNFSGTAVGIDAPILTVQYAVDGWVEGPLSVVDNGNNYGNWSVSLPVPPGQHLLRVNAIDRFGTASSIAKPIVVQPKTPIVVPPGGRTTLSGAPTSSSVTSWTRLEPQSNGADIGISASARVFDPLWLMTRQWQMGEFQGEDAGTPAMARVRATNAMLTRSFVGELPRPATPSSAAVSVAGTPYDPARTPLEVIAERRAMRPADAGDTRMLSLAVEAGLHFLRMLELQAPSKNYRSAFIARLALQRPPDGATTDEATRRYLDSMQGRAPDGRVLAVRLRSAGGAALLAADPLLAIVAVDQPKVQAAATAWLAWYDAVCSEPTSASGDAWLPSRLEYAMAVGTRLSAAAQDDITYVAAELDGSPVDWASFDVHAQAALGTAASPAFAPVVETTIPAPVSFRGAPAPRFWEMEDSQVAYGLVPVGPTDLAHLMMIEYASSYGNDWFAVPLTLPVGSVTRVESLVVTDTFGVRSLVRAIGDAALPPPYFSMWQPSYAQPPAGSALKTAVNRFFLPSSLGRSLDSGPLEEVLFMRDEMANLAWAVERSVENPIEQPAQRDEAADATPPVVAPTSAWPHYRLSTTVPFNWVPLLPVEQPNPLFPNNPAQVISRLQKGAVLQPDGTRTVHSSVGEVLNAATPLLLYDEEVPREGTRVTRQRRLTRWSDGSTWLWTSLRNRVGQGEGSSGLTFDAVDARRQE
ncbi:hypothetical protein [Rhizobacter sp. OV335]|uniref:hypothetical protein n=1 Tax=Rhizobacter sp. OV335 TaxID=1500264 RepID=UPI0009219A17|nr:hypothetical protein [Rhizobacter sp. OV335]SHN13462.1 hypothetical protein SAMN02787076_03520 [Rhizobacter sp. OV335]